MRRRPFHRNVQSRARAPRRTRARATPDARANSRRSDVHVHAPSVSRSPLIVACAAVFARLCHRYILCPAAGRAPMLAYVAGCCTSSAREICDPHLVFKELTSFPPLAPVPPPAPLITARALSPRSAHRGVLPSPPRALIRAGQYARRRAACQRRSSARENRAHAPKRTHSASAKTRLYSVLVSFFCTLLLAVIGLHGASQHSAEPVLSYCRHK
eukprot:IDg1111t1